MIPCSSPLHMCFNCTLPLPKKVKQVLIKRINRDLNQPKVKVKIADKPVEPWYNTIKKIGIK